MNALLHRLVDRMRHAKTLSEVMSAFAILVSECLLPENASTSTNAKQELTAATKMQTV